MTTFTRDWDAAYEAAPTDDNFVYEIDNYMRQMIVDVRERMEVDHIWKVGATDGEHKQITVSASLGAAPTTVAGKMFIYSKDLAGKPELYVKDGDGDEVLLTKAGASMSFAVGTKSIFYQDTAPIGWTIEDTLNDKLLFITKGSTAGGQVGGGAHSTGTWTHPDHTHLGPEHQHNTTIPITGYGGEAVGGVDGYMQTNNSGNIFRATTSPAVASSASGTGGTGGNQNLASFLAWRPAAYCAIIATKD